MIHYPSLSLAVLMVACLEPPRQDLRDQNAMGMLTEGPAGTSFQVQPSFELKPNEPVQRIHITVEGFSQGRVEIEHHQGILPSLLGLAPRALHVQAFERSSFFVTAPISLREKVDILAFNTMPAGPAAPRAEDLCADYGPLLLAGEDVEVRLVAGPCTSRGPAPMPVPSGPSGLAPATP